MDKLSQLPPPGSTASSGSPPGGQTIPYPYEGTPGGLLWNKETAESIIPIPLTTFIAVITGQVVEDDGAEVRRLLEIEATMRGRTCRCNIPAGQLATMAWPMEHLGAAALWPGFGVKDHARAAIQFLSEDSPERRVYTHLGWRKIGEHGVTSTPEEPSDQWVRWMRSRCLCLRTCNATATGADHGGGPD